MTTKYNISEGGTDTTAISTANSGGTSGDAWNTILGTAPTFATGAAVHGSLGISAAAASGAQSALKWTGLGSTSVSVVFYYKYTTRTVLTQLIQFRTAVGAVAGVVQNASGNTIGITNSAGSNLSPSAVSAAMTNGSTYRFEVQVFSSATVGTVDYQMYLGDSGTALTTYTSGADENTRGGNITEFSIGKFSTSTDTTAFLFDSVRAVDGTLTPLGPMGISGTLASTLDGSTLAASGTETFTGTLASTLSDATLAATGTETITGTLSATLDGAALTAAGTETISGTLATTLDDATLAASGGQTIAGTLAATLAGASLDATGAETISGTLASTLDGATLAATGDAGSPPVTGTLASTLDGATLAATGVETITGTLTVQLDGATLAALATETMTGVLASTLAGVTMTSSATLPRDVHFISVTDRSRTVTVTEQPQRLVTITDRSD